MTTRFSCTGCGKCCSDHHVPLTLTEAIDWVRRKGELIVLVEAFLDAGPGISPQQRPHAERRSLPVRCGAAQAYLAITFAGYNVGPCIHLDNEQRCSIYEQRPLVCRIYPFEINPHLPLRPESKDCPPQAWQPGPALIHGGQLLDAGLAELIERSRQADRDEIASKVAICALLGIRTTALKGDGFATYRPQADAFLAAAEQVLGGTAPTPDVGWELHLSHAQLAEQLRVTGALISAALDETCAFVALTAA